MSKLEEYRNLQKQLMWIRWTHQGHDSDEEDTHLDLMDEAWWKLTDKDRNLISSEPPLRDFSKDDPIESEMIDVDPVEHSGPVRKTRKKAA